MSKTVFKQKIILSFMPFFNLTNKNKLTLASHNIQVFKSLSLFIFIMLNKTGKAFFRIPIRRN